MTDRDRMIELIRRAKIEEVCCTSDGEPVTKWQRNIVDRVEAKYLADYLLANGVIVPPCKVGDTLFCIFSDKSIDKVYIHIETCRVTDIKYFASDSFVFGVREINRHYNHNVVLGENAFKTFEEAEAKLKELNNNVNL